MTQIPLHTMIRRPAVVLLDFETTGLKPEADHRVIEIAATRWDGSGRREFSTMVRPDPMPAVLDSFVTERSGISREQIEAGMPSFEACALLSGLIADAVIVGHNVGFDLGFLDAELAHHRLRRWAGDFLCTRALATFLRIGKVRPNARGNMILGTRLEDIVAALDLTLEGAHRAGNDIAATEAVLPYLWQRAMDGHRPTFNALVRPVWLQGSDEYVPPRASVYLYDDKATPQEVKAAS